MHSDPAASLDLQYWFAPHTSSPHLHAAVFTTDPSMLEHAPQAPPMSFQYIILKINTDATPLIVVAQLYINPGIDVHPFQCVDARVKALDCGRRW